MKKKITIVCLVLIILLVTVCISACTDAMTADSIYAPDFVALSIVLLNESVCAL